MVEGRQVLQRSPAHSSAADFSRAFVVERRSVSSAPRLEGKARELEARAGIFTSRNCSVAGSTRRSWWFARSGFFMSSSCEIASVLAGTETSRGGGVRAGGSRSRSDGPRLLLLCSRGEEEWSASEFTTLRAFELVIREGSR